MKTNKHPEMHDIVVHCACGQSFKTTSTLPSLNVTICSNCHPFYTGATKFLDTAGRIEKFHNKYKKNASR